jgi:hypothetical protein
MVVGIRITLVRRLAHPEGREDDRPLEKARTT